MMNMTGMDGMGKSMPMVFTTDHSTPLYSSAWTPMSKGDYAGTCIFLVVLGVIARLLQAYRQSLEAKWHKKAMQRPYVLVAGAPAEKQTRVTETEKPDEASQMTRGSDANVKTSRTGSQPKPWRFSTDLPRACIFTVQAGVLYLLMLAVMTMNVGYFLSVLAGLFVGELTVGRYALPSDGHH